MGSKAPQPPPPREENNPKTEHHRWVQSADLNTRDQLFGGRLLEWIDVDASATAALCLKQGTLLATVNVNIDFISPVDQGSLLTLIHEVVYVGKTSMGVKSTVYNHDVLVSTGYVTFVNVHGTSGRSRDISSRVIAEIAQGEEWKKYEKFRPNIQQQTA